MYLYSIMHLDTDHVDEICEDIREQYESGVANCALFKFTLTPEGDPPIDKAKILCEKYDVFRDKLKEMGIGCGVLVQASIGHGWKLNCDSVFEKYTDLKTGIREIICCPYDEGFRKYAYEFMRTIASHKPELIMVDDDFRLLQHGGGCACSLHIKHFNELTGNHFTNREELLAAVSGKGEQEMKNLHTYIETQGEALIGAAKAMREGIDSVDPKIPGAFCACGNGAEFANEIAKILAGKGNPIIIRVNNGNYIPAGARNFAYQMYRAATQMAAMKREADVFLAETDTCPQNRYSTGAMSVHAHFTGTIIEGAKGCKHWITRAAFEPESGKYYRKVLSRYHGFYEKLFEIMPTLTPVGCRIPLSCAANYEYPGYNYISDGEAESRGWIECVLERFGLPMFFSEKEHKNSAVFLSGNDTLRFSDDEIKEFLKGCVFLDADAAENLVERGFVSLLGVYVREWKGLHLAGERFLSSGSSCNSMYRAKELVPVNENVVELSYNYHVPDGKTEVRQCPGVTKYKNELGGTAVVFCGSAYAPYTITTAFSMLNATRKRQIRELLTEFGCAPVYYPEDAEVYMRTFTKDDGTLAAAVFNIGLDPIEELPLVIEKDFTAIERLCADGSIKPCTYTKDGNTVRLDITANTLDPVVLFIK